MQERASEVPTFLHAKALQSQQQQQQQQQQLQELQLLKGTWCKVCQGSCIDTQSFQNHQLAAACC